MCLTPITYEWWSAISEGDGLGLRSLPRFKPQLLADGVFLSRIAEDEFSFVGPSCDLVRTGEASHHTRERRGESLGVCSMTPLFMILEVGFRLVIPSRGQPNPRLYHTPYRNWVFKSIFSSGDDEAIADGVCAWIVDSNHMPAGTCVDYLAKRVEEDPPFSPRLRRMGIRLIEHMWYHESGVSKPETIRLLNRLDVGLDDMQNELVWITLLVEVMCSPAGLEALSVHYWHLLEGLPPARILSNAQAMELMRSLEEVGDWEKLEILMTTAWRYDGYEHRGPTEELEHLKQVTLRYLLQRPSVLPRFEGLAELAVLPSFRAALQHTCVQARTERLHLEPPPPYVFEVPFNACLS